MRWQGHGSLTMSHRRRLATDSVFGPDSLICVGRDGRKLLAANNFPQAFEGQIEQVRTVAAQHGVGPEAALLEEGIAPTWTSG